MDPQEKINLLRNKIDELDSQLLEFLVQRFSVSREIGEIKTSKGIDIRDPNREKEIIERLTNKLDGKLDKDDIASIFGPIYKISKRLQKNK
jgi:chorismate mutase